MSKNPTAAGSPSAYRAPGVLTEMVRFGLIGATNAVLEMVLFTLLIRHAVAPPAAKLGSTLVTAVTSYYANRCWTWRHRPGEGGVRNLTQFVGISFVGLAIAEVCLLVSHYGAGFHGVIADNLAANVVGLGLATGWRFWASRRWLFTATPTTSTVPDTNRVGIERISLRLASVPLLSQPVEP
jgi:putative flippase GtrA